MDSQVRVLELESSLQQERLRLAALRRHHYQLAGEAEGWEKKVFKIIFYLNLVKYKFVSVWYHFQMSVGTSYFLVTPPFKECLHFLKEVPGFLLFLSNIFIIIACGWHGINLSILG
jgi:I/LWEQ domain